MQQSFTSKKYYPWLVITFCALFLFYKYILQVSPSVMTDQLMNAFRVNGAGLGNLAATFFYAYLIMQLFVGVLLDRYSPRLLTSLAILICAAGTFIFASAHHLVIAGFARALIGLGTAFATVSYMKMVSVWFRSDQFAFVGGLLATAAMLGAIFGQAPLALLVGHVGWRDSLIICAIFGFVIAVGFLIIVRDKRIGTVETVVVQHKQPFSLNDLREVFQNSQNWLLTFYTGLAFTPIAVFGGLWGNPFLVVKYNISSAHAASLVSLIFIGLAFGSPLIGIISDKLGQRRKVMIVCSAISFITLLPAIYLDHIPAWLLSACLFIFGFTSGAFMLGYALAKDLNKLALAATVIALINTGDAVFGSITEPLIGKFLDLGWNGKIVNGIHYFTLKNYQLALIVLPLYVLIGLILLFFVKEPMKN